MKTARKKRMTRDQDFFRNLKLIQTDIAIDVSALFITTVRFNTTNPH